MDADNLEPETKRRKIRKGTRSCWECKGRKAKCTYLTPEDKVCDGCFRRGTKCVSQELPEVPLAVVDRRRQMGSRMVRVETLIEKLVKKSGDEPTIPDTPISTSSRDPSVNAQNHTSLPIGVVPTTDDDTTNSPTTSPGIQNTHLIENKCSSGFPRYENPSASLLAVFPSQECIDMIVKTAGPMASFFHQLVDKPYKDIQVGEKEHARLLAELTIRHSVKTHPLIIARQMLLLAITFRYIRPEFQNELRSSSEPAVLVMKRVADTALDFITTNDKMMNNIDGIACHLLAASLQADNGNLRSGWSTIRRAMIMAQLMCLHRTKRPPLRFIEPDNKWDPQYLWYRIVYFDRFFSLILGLPQGSADSSMGSAFPFNDDTPMGRLERRHCVLAGRILQRNEYDPGSEDLIDTQAIDKELRQLSESMPSKWWLVPDLGSIGDNTTQLFWESTRLTNQVFHYILLSHLHLPFMLRSSTGADQHQYEYGRLTCVNASRDLLIRYRGFRTFSHVSYCCHSMDFFAITACMTLLLAHLDGHRQQRTSDISLVHQRVSDRAIMEELLDNMEQVGTLNKAKTLSEKGAGVLRQLLVIESDAASGTSYRVETTEELANDSRALRLSIPYFGVITIIREAQATVQSQNFPNSSSGLYVDAMFRPQRTGGLHDNLPSVPAGGLLSRSHGSRAEKSTALNLLPRQETLPPSEFTDMRTFDPPLGGVDQGDYAFQGDDMTLFDALMSESEEQTEYNTDFWWLQ